MLGASASITVFIARPMNVPVIGDVRAPLAPLPVAFAWERFATEDGIRELGWLSVLRWGTLWPAL